MVYSLLLAPLRHLPVAAWRPPSSHLKPSHASRRDPSPSGNPLLVSWPRAAVLPQWVIATVFWPLFLPSSTFGFTQQGGSPQNPSQGVIPSEQNLPLGSSHPHSALAPLPPPPTCCS